MDETQLPHYPTTPLLSTIAPLHPLFAVAGITLAAAVGAVMGRVVPFYRRELNVEAKTRLTPLDGLRGILCFAVMYHHAAVTYDFLGTGHWEPPVSAFYDLLGSASVGFFFCVTGFLFWSRALASGGKVEPVPFLRARFFRIVPLYAFTCLLAIVLLARQVHWLSVSTLHGLIVMGSMGIRRWVPLGSVDVVPVNAGVTWTLQYEWGFYLALPALALLASTKKLDLVLLLAAAVFVTFDNGQYVYFLPGMIAAHLARRPQIVQVLQRRYIALCAILLLTALPFLTHFGYGYKAELIVGLTFLPIACGNDVFGILNLKGLRLLGVISYSVYLLHGFALYLAKPLLIRAKYASADNVVKYWACIYALSCVALVVSMITYRWIELPCIQFEKRLRRSPREPQIVQSASLIPATTP
jgi:peptidoglycan/LPS O-acetylase OafA/YrhL